MRIGKIEPPWAVSLTERYHLRTAFSSRERVDANFRARGDFETRENYESRDTRRLELGIARDNTESSLSPRDAFTEIFPPKVPRRFGRRAVLAELVYSVTCDRATLFDDDIPRRFTTYVNTSGRVRRAYTVHFGAQSIRSLREWL